MTKTFFTLLLLFIFSSLFGQIFHGTIADKYPILIELEAPTKLAINGSYQYKKIGKDLTLKGSFTSEKDLLGARDFQLKEYDSSGRVTGLFTGTWSEDLMVNRAVLHGEWTNPKTNKKLPFVAMEQKSIELNKPYIFPEIYSMKNEELDYEAFLALPKFHKITKRAAYNIESHLTFEALLEEPFKDIRLNYEKCACGHVGLNYKVHYLEDSIMSLEMQSEFLGPYPSFHQQFFNFDTHTGEILPYYRFITAEELPKVLAILNEELSKRKASMEEGKEHLDDMTITKEDLKAFSLSGDGIIFHIEYPLPHYLIPFEPSREYKVLWSDLD